METVKHFQNKYGLIDFEFAGYEISRPKDIFFNHTGIVLGVSVFTNEVGVMHSHPSSGGVEFTWISSYAQGEKVFYTDAIPEDRQASLMRAFSLLEEGQNYHILDNCQHASSYCIYGESKSNAVENLTDGLLWGGLLAGIIGVATENKALTKIGFTAAGVGGLGKIAQHTHQERKRTNREVKFHMVVNSIKEESNFQVRLNKQFL